MEGEVPIITIPGKEYSGELTANGIALLEVKDCPIKVSLLESLFQCIVVNFFFPFHFFVFCFVLFFFFLLFFSFLALMAV